jgi:peptidoglycan/LPS O-acetylase OafA/YrhL
MNEKKRFEVLDSFRGISAVFIMIFHMHYNDSITELSFIRGSWLFVEYFFILSGFVLSHGYMTKKINFKSFFKARFFRIFPLHIVMLLVFILLETFKLVGGSFFGFNFINPGFTGNNAISEILPNLFLVHALTDKFQYLSFNYTSWTISVEFFMYIVFFGLLTLNKYMTKIATLFVICCVMAYYIFYDIDLLQSNLIRGLFNFFLGILLYFLYSRVPKRDYKISVIYFSIFEVLMCLLIVFVVSNYLVGQHMLYSFVFCLTIFIFSFGKGVVSHFLKLPLFKMLGLLSYSIYLIHPAVLFCIKTIFIVVNKTTALQCVLISDDKWIYNMTTGSKFGDNLVVFLSVVLVLTLSSITYNRIELKWIRAGRKIKQKLGKT